MDPKKILILVVLLIGLVFAGKWTCNEWKRYHPPAAPYSSYGAPYGGAYDYDTGAGEAPPAKAPGE